ncbi:MAG: heparinase II/III family protein [Bryobacteraceae bacterium]
MRPALASGFLFALTAWCAPVYPPDPARADVAALLRSTEWVRSLDETALRALVPTRSGLFFVGCPNCSHGRQEDQLSWKPETPGEVFCRYCGHRYPSPKYPMKVQRVRNPRGTFHEYPYWEDPKGYRYYFPARRDDLVRRYLSARASELGILYVLTGKKEYARHAAILIDRFAQVFPSWCFHYDYPFSQKEIYHGKVAPADFRAGYRTARWNWWAYGDLPLELVQAYDWIRESGVLAELSREAGVDVAARIERDLFREAADEVLAHRETYGNMSPSAWNSLIVAGRVIGEPRYVDEPLRRLRTFLETRYFYDASWPEGAPSYHQQTVNWLSRVVEAAAPGTPGLGEARTAIRRSREALDLMRFPDGRLVPVHDTWSTDRREPIEESRSWLLPALGHASLGAGRGDRQAQLHLTWSGGYGHQHADQLSLILFARGREALSDIGYTHTRYRAWTLAAAAHNTVVIDGVPQFAGTAGKPSDGALRWFDTRDPRIHSVSADGERAYPELAKRYRRTLYLVDGKYAVDIFEVEGGVRHDYFLHGGADEDTLIESPLAFRPLASLLPEGLKWTAPVNEYDVASFARPFYAYGMLRDLREVEAASPVKLMLRPAKPGSPGTRITLLPQVAGRVVTGTGPSVRRAGEDDARLEDTRRPFLLLRQEPPKGRSVFVSVIEWEPTLDSVERITLPGAAAAVKLSAGGTTHLLVHEAERMVKVPASSHSASFSGQAGWLELRSGEVSHAWARGEGGWRLGRFRLDSPRPERAEVAGFEHDTVVTRTPLTAGAGDTLRIVTGDGWTYPVGAAASSEGTRLRTVENVAGIFETTSSGFRLKTFPKREHQGKIWIEQAVSRSYTQER